MRTFLAVVGGILLILAIPYGCILILQEPLANPTRIKTDIYFRHPDGTPDANDEVYVTEGLGGPPGPVTTEIRHTDANGHVVLEGDYCTSEMIVAVAGGSVFFAGGNVPPSYTVTVEPGGHSPEIDLGPLTPEHARGSALERHCDR